MTKPRSIVTPASSYPRSWVTGPAADGDEQQLGLDGLAVLERDDDAVLVLGDALEADAELVLDAALAERALEVLGDRLLLVRHEVGERLDDRDVGAERLPDARELDADDAAAEDRDLLRDEVELERLLARDDAAADLEAGQRARVGAGGEHDVLADEAVVADLDGVRGDEAALAFDEGDAARLDESLQALELARDDALAVLRHRRDVDALERRADAELRGLAGVVGDLGGVQQRLRRDASAVQARAAELVLLDEATVRPSWTARSAAAYPPLPPPRTTRSKFCSDKRISLAHRISGANCVGSWPGRPSGDDRPTRLYYLAASCSPSATRVRTAAPVAPAPVNPHAAALLNDGPAMSRCAHGIAPRPRRPDGRRTAAGTPRRGACPARPFRASCWRGRRHPTSGAPSGRRAAAWARPARPWHPRLGAPRRRGRRRPSDPRSGCRARRPARR